MASSEPASSPVPPLRGRLVVLVAIVCTALNLRLVATALTPLLSQIGTQLRFGTATIGVFGLPLAAFAVFGLLIPV